MSYDSSYSPWYCAAFQSALNAKCADPLNQRTAVGVLSALMTPANQTTVQFNQPGKLIPINLQYSRRPTISDVSTTAPTSFCTPGISPDLGSVTIKPQFPTYLSKSFSDDQIRQLCQDKTPFMMNEVNGMFDALAQQIDLTILTELDAINTPIRGGGSLPTLDLIAANQQVNYDTWAYFRKQMNNIGCGGMPFIVDDAEFYTLASRLDIPCCNTVQGIDYAGMRGQFAYFNDALINSSPMGSNAFVAFVPGAIQIIPWILNAGQFAAPVGNILEKGTIIDPVTGMTYDMTVAVDSCAYDTVTTITVGLYWSLFILPDDAYKAADPLYQTVGFLKGETTP